MLQTLFLIAKVEKIGGLFDFDGTLPIIALQFLVLMYLLNILLYTPLLNVISERNQYINKNLTQASLILAQATKLSQQYELELVKTRKEAQLEISIAQRSHKKILELEVQSSQKIFDSYLTNITNNLKAEKSEILTSLEEEIDSLSNEIMIKITT